jgi:hypothetical protein
MSELKIPNFGELLAPFIAQVPEQNFPNFLALLERGAAERYRQWADEIPEHCEGLLMCAQREDEIADTVDELFPFAESAREALEAPLPAARDCYYSVFTGLDLHDQLATQANAERQGAAAWRGMSEGEENLKIRARLEHCALLEEASAAYLDHIISES